MQDLRDLKQQIENWDIFMSLEAKSRDNNNVLNSSRFNECLIEWFRLRDENVESDGEDLCSMRSEEKLFASFTESLKSWIITLQVICKMNIFESIYLRRARIYFHYFFQSLIIIIENAFWKAFCGCKIDQMQQRWSLCGSIFSSNYHDYWDKWHQYFEYEILSIATNFLPLLQRLPVGFNFC